VLQCVAMCCSVLQCVAALPCSIVGGPRETRDSQTTWRILQWVGVCCSVLQCVAVCCSVLQCAAVCCNLYVVVSQEGHERLVIQKHLHVFELDVADRKFHLYNAVRCSVVQCVAVRRSVLQCVAVLTCICSSST